MTFKTKPNTYSLGLAPSSRAKCRGCKGMVQKGDVRVVTHAFVRPNRATYFVRHVRCATAACVAGMLKAHGSIDRVPVRLAVVCAARRTLSTLTTAPSPMVQKTEGGRSIEAAACSAAHELCATLKLVQAASAWRTTSAPRRADHLPPTRRRAQLALRNQAAPTSMA